MVPEFGEPKARIHAYMAGALIVYATAYTVFNVPYLAMSAEMTTDTRARTSLMSYRAVASIVGGGLIGALAPWIVTYFGDNRNGFEKMGLIIGSIVLLCCLAAFFMTSKARFTQPVRAEGIPFRTQLRTAMGNRPFLILCAAMFFFLICTNVIAGATVFFVIYVLNEPVAWLTPFFPADHSGRRCCSAADVMDVSSMGETKHVSYRRAGLLPGGPQLVAGVSGRAAVAVPVPSHLNGVRRGHHGGDGERHVARHHGVRRAPYGAQAGGCAGWILLYY